MSTRASYITFKLGDEEYGIELVKLRELIGLLEITRLPRARPHIRGLINLRGKVIPVVDLRVKFAMAPAEPTQKSVIMVMQLDAGNPGSTTGILVDEVLEVRAIPKHEVEPSPTLSEHVDMSFIQGVGKVDSRVVFLLDIDRILRHDVSEPSRAVEEASLPC
jgi:purine-binding chemotaxis protein CheW